jgi:hypothetical protein
MNPELVYLAGYFWADGSINKNSCSLNIIQKDSIQVQEIVKPFLNFSTYFYINKNEDAKRQPQESIKFNLKEDNWLNSLIKEYYLNKSIESPWFVSDFPKELQHYFWRGYSDGDGCFYKRKDGAGGWSLSGSYEKDWSYELNKFKELGLSDRKIYKNISDNGNKSSCIMFRNIKDVIKIGEYLYSGLDFGLKRKKEKYEQLASASSKYELTSKYIGINLDKAAINSGRKKIWKCSYNRKHIGYFETEEEAKLMRELYIDSLKPHSFL